MKKEITLYDNAFDVMRLYAALQVFIGHYILWYGLSLGTLGNRLFIAFQGVPVLFAVGGVLVTASLERSKNKREFMKKRFVRLYPEFWVSVIVNLAVIYFVGYKYNLFSFNFLKWIVLELMGICTTPDFLSGYSVGSFNGALWTIMVEVQLYFITLIAYPITKKVRLSKWVIILAVFYVTEMCRIVFPDARVIQLLDRTFLTHATAYLMGMTIYSYREELFSKIEKVCLPLTIAYLLFCLICPSTALSKSVALIIVPICVIGLAYKIGRIQFKFDISYSIYLYHMIFINVWIYFGIKAGVKEFLLLCLCVGCVASLSGYAFSIISRKLKRMILC